MDHEFPVMDFESIEASIVAQCSNAQLAALLAARLAAKDELGGA